MLQGITIKFVPALIFVVLAINTIAAIMKWW